MKNDFLTDTILHYFGHTPTADQSEALAKMLDFLASPEQGLFLLKGYAGTGKTSLISALVRGLRKINRKVVLLAPTGRAAKVFSTYAEMQSFTIHKKIYRQRSSSEAKVNFKLAENLHTDTLFIVDEASMIGNEPSAGGEIFGSGRLLDDLIEFVYAGTRCRLMLMGDTAQLPPVGLPASPALDKETLSGYFIPVEEYTLRQVVRQDEASGILSNATALRATLDDHATSLLPKVRVAGCADMLSITGSDLIEALSSAYSRSGLENTIVVTRSNKRANRYNEGIRNTIFNYEEQISSGDLLIVAKNNYFWTEGMDDFDFIANGEVVEVVKVRKRYELYGLRFADLLVRFRDYNVELTVKILLDGLFSESASLTKETSDRLFTSVWEDYSDVRSSRLRMMKLKKDPHFNALVVKYAYAVTCHKAQGGQWSNVFVDIGDAVQGIIDDDFYRWFYTAVTRATERIYLVNLPARMADLQ